MPELGKTLIITGILILLVGLFLSFFQKVPIIGKLPGDIYIDRPGFKFYFPITTSIIISLIIILIWRFFK